MVYATCTLSPWENEYVLTEFLSHRSDVEVKPIEMQHKHSPGLSSWQGVHFDASLTKTIRLWPHQNNTGGFFVALLEKKRIDVAEKNKMVIEPGVFPALSSADYDLLQQALWHFGISLDALSDYRFYSTKKGIVMCSADHSMANTVRLDATGLLFLKGRNRFAKLTTGAACQVAPLATKNKVYLQADQLKCFMQRETITLSASQCMDCENHSYVLVYGGGYGVGIGWFRQQNEVFSLQSFYPKSLAL